MIVPRPTSISLRAYAGFSAVRRASWAARFLSCATHTRSRACDWRFICLSFLDQAIRAL